MDHMGRPENVTKLQIFPLAGFIWLFCQYFIQEKCLSASNWSFLGHSHVGLLFTIEEQKKAVL